MAERSLISLESADPCRIIRNHATFAPFLVYSRHRLDLLCWLDVYGTPCENLYRKSNHHPCSILLKLKTRSILEVGYKK